MQWMELEFKDLVDVLESSTIKHLLSILNYKKNLIDLSEFKKTKVNLVQLFVELLDDENFKRDFYEELSATPISKKLYHILIWRQKNISCNDASLLLGIDITSGSYMGYNQNNKLNGNLNLISYSQSWNSDNLFIDEKIRTILKLIHPAPDDIMIEPVENPKKTKYHYSNESSILSTILTMKDMLDTDLIAIGKTGEKPLAKTLNTLNYTTDNSEFYTTSKLDNLSMDMLTRSFYHYYNGNYKFNKTPLTTLRNFVNAQFRDKVGYSISRVFLSHIKKIRFYPYYAEQKPIFDIMKELIDEMPKKEWVSIESMISYCLYRDYRYDMESHYTTQKYYLPIKGKTSWDSELYANDNNYNAIIFEPIIKALLFYLGALGIVELKYDDPISPHSITAKDKPYISVWDGLKYVKLTALGRYIFGFEAKYTAPKIVQKASTVKFDEYKPVMTIQSDDAIMLAKIEPYTEKVGSNRYALSYSKIFRDCKTKKMLEMKIDKFYMLFDKPIPVLFDNYFDEIIAKSNMLKRDLSQVVIELDNDKKLLNLFVTNKKLQELVVKASGYRVIVSKTNLSKLTKIVRDNGFFVEF